MDGQIFTDLSAVNVHFRIRGRAAVVGYICHRLHLVPNKDVLLKGVSSVSLINTLVKSGERVLYLVYSLAD